MMKELILQRIIYRAKYMALAGLVGALALSRAEAGGEESAESTLVAGAEATWKDACIKLIQRGDEESEKELKALLLPLAEGGDATAQLVLAVRDRSAYTWYEKAAAQGNADALWIMGLRVTGSPDDAKNAEYWQRAAEAGHVGAQWELACAALCGPLEMRLAGAFISSGFTTSDPRPCIELAEKGHVMATCALAEYYRRGKNSAAAAEWSARAAELGDAASMQYLARQGMEAAEAENEPVVQTGKKKRGRGRSSKPKKPTLDVSTRPFKAGANKWEQQLFAAANRGYYLALLDITQLTSQTKARIGVYYLAIENLNYRCLESYVNAQSLAHNANATDREYIMLRDRGFDRGDKFWSKMESLAQRGHIEAVYDMGIQKESSMRWEDDEEIAATHRAAAIKWYRQAVQAKHVAAHERLGVLLEDQPKNAKEVFKLYKYAASKDVASAKTRLGKCYLTGKGTTADPKKAVKCFSEAAEYWDAAGLYELALCYYHGLGVERDVKKAQELTERYIDIYGFADGFTHSSLGTMWHIKDSRNWQRWDFDPAEPARMNRDAISLYLLLR